MQDTDSISSEDEFANVVEARQCGWCEGESEDVGGTTYPEMLTNIV